MEIRWKRAFFLLLFLVLASLMSFVYLALKPMDPIGSQDQGGRKAGNIEMDIHLNGKDLEGMFQGEMKKRDLPGQLIIHGDFLFIFPVQVLGQGVDLSLRGLPTVSPDGNIGIDVREIGIGKAKAAKRLALGLLSQILDDTSPLKVGQGGRLLIDLTSIGKERNFGLRCKSIDIGKDQYIFTALIQGEENH